jgi:uncharacterized protein with PIN domain
MCPDCGGAELKYRYAEWVEPHGERCAQEWYECPGCREIFTESELGRLERDEEGA